MRGKIQRIRRAANERPGSLNDCMLTATVLPPEGCYQLDSELPTFQGAKYEYSDRFCHNDADGTFHPP